MNSVLIVEDMQEINDLLKKYLEKNEQTCTQAFSGSEAILLLEKYSFDLVLLDLMLPGLKGENILEQVKKNYHLPVIVISAKDSIETRVKLLELGADDYICKPFDLSEVLARIRVQLRKKCVNTNNNIIKSNNIELNISTHEVFIDHKPLVFTKHEFLIFQLLIESPNQVFTKQMIYENAWQEDYYGDERIVNTHIGNIRAKLRKYNKEDCIQTVWGIGFKFMQ